MSKEKETNRQLSIDEIKNIVNKKAGQSVAATFNESKLLEVPYWISTSSRWLDSIICKGKRSGIPGGHITEIAAVNGAGKSFLALMIAKNAMKMGIKVVYFDAEGGVDKDFVSNCEINMDEIIHIPVQSMEKMFNIIDNLLSNTSEKYLFIWDSYAATPCEKEIEGEFDPSSHMAVGPRVANLAMKKLLIPLLEKKSTLIVLNQIRDNIGADKWTLLKEPYKVPGGNQLKHCYTLRLWLFVGQAKDDAIIDSTQAKIGHNVTVKIKKSRHGTEGRRCKLSFLWGSTVNKIADEELWMEALEGCADMQQGGWNKLVVNGKEISFRASEWMEKLKDKDFRAKVDEIFDKHLLNFTGQPEVVAEDVEEEE